MGVVTEAGPRWIDVHLDGDDADYFGAAGEAVSWTCMCGTSSDFGHQYGCTGTRADVATVEPYGREYRAGAAVAFGLMGMAGAIGENDRMLACPHCGLASSARVYCEHAMCDPAECHYWICNDCDETGRDHSVAPRMSVEPKEET